MALLLPVLLVVLLVGGLNRDASYVSAAFAKILAAQTGASSLE
jgi:hypothetical protein